MLVLSTLFLSVATVTRASMAANIVHNGSCKIACVLPGARVRVMLRTAGRACAPKRFYECTSHCLHLGGISTRPRRF